MSHALDHLAHLARLHEDALRTAALEADPDDADALIARAGERASQVEQLRDLDRPHGATAAALPPEPHAPTGLADSEAALAAACTRFLADPASQAEAKSLVSAVLATCRPAQSTN